MDRIVKQPPAEELPFYLDLMAHLARHGIPCPAPIADLSDQYLGQRKESVEPFDIHSWRVVDRLAYGGNGSEPYRRYRTDDGDVSPMAIPGQPGGEQPGDQEDLTGRPFVGPAGRLFDASLEEAGIDRKRVYVTNAVKHFKFQQRGKRRLHSRPGGGEIKACRWWLQHELELIRPPLTVALGATAARSLFGKIVTIGKLRGEPQSLADGSECWVTVHPSALLRAPDEDARREGLRQFVADLRQIKKRAAQLA